MLATIKILWNSLKMALQELKVNKLRTFLSLLGITIGIFCIIAVFTVTDSMESNIRSDVQELGSDVIYVQKWPWGGGGEYPWWKYMNRPQPEFKDLRVVQDKVKSASASAFAFSAYSKRVEYRDDYMEGVEMIAVTQEFERIQQPQIIAGRYFTGNEGSSNVVILGANIWEGLFTSAETADGKVVQVAGRPCKIIGLLKKKGESLLGGINYDNAVIVPYGFGRTIVDERRFGDPYIMVKAASGVDLRQLKDELKGVLRAAHRLRPTEEDDFSLNEITTLSSNLAGLFAALNIGGGIIAIFALIVGGFGIANIMFVTVKERTNIIGLKKAIGARRSVIMMEFLLEAILLCLIGGGLGLLFVYTGTLLAGGSQSFAISLSAKNVILGLSISGIVGILAGFIPAFTASKLDPVVAIRSN
ncbi:ABC transporter permease [Chitinophaga japonensis]|uniref:Putative ABC transport system permease protein n=1 Tax=Chitinophaga japonensis TaxID=104662 RepID=A0A562SMZ0_CHIJA|nr:ABC transporter permease [Chitinophaga japonensis]TWI82645.1 putative ABC transport system permease protein [Chitinophaga japonensis]